MASRSGGASQGCVIDTHTHTHTHTHAHTHTHNVILYIYSLSRSLSHSLSLTHTHSSWPAEVVQCLEDILDIQAQLVYDHLPPEAQAKWMALSYVALPGGRGGGGGGGFGGRPRNKVPGRLLRVNAFDDAQGFANMYQLSSRINHSCVPNCLRFAGEENQVKVVTRQPIEKGQEIFISYLDCAKGGSSAGMTVRQRREHLSRQFGFRCMCPLCRKQAAPPPWMENRPA